MARETSIYTDRNICIVRQIAGRRSERISKRTDFQSIINSAYSYICACEFQLTW